MKFIKEELLRKAGVVAFPLARFQVFEEIALDANARDIYTGAPVLVSDLVAGGFRFPIPPVITVSGRKSIQSTATSGGLPVIEIISNESWQVSVRGYIKNTESEAIGGLVFESTAFPEQALRDMRNLFLLNESVEVACELFTYFGITQCVITDFKFAPLEGYANAFGYEMSMISDVPVELELLDPKT